MELNMAMPVDDDGYLDRECPNCERVFRWHAGPIEDPPSDAPEVDEYFCPYCGLPAGVDQWWTREQIEAAQTVALSAVMPGLQQDLEDALDGVNRSGLIRAEVIADPVRPAPPLYLSEGDAQAVASPCHPYEPVKLLGDWHPPIHCLVCGAPYRV